MLSNANANAMQVALAHLLFNTTGIIIWYPLPFMRNVPLHCARQLGKGTRIWKGLPLVYIGVCFFLIPLLFLGISTMFTQGAKGLTVLGSFVVIFMFLGSCCCWTAYYCHYKGGKQKFYDCPVNRRYAVPQGQIKELAENTGLPDDGDEESPIVETPPSKEEGTSEGEGEEGSTDEDAA